MNFVIIVTSQAEFDLQTIFQYISYELNFPAIAAKQLEHLEKRVLKLDTFPMRFNLYDKEPWKSRGLRYVPVDNYIIFFIPNTADNTVSIIRVMHCSRNTDDQLSNSTIIN